MPVKTIVQDKKALSIPCSDVPVDCAELHYVIQDLMDTAHYHSTQLNKSGCAGLAANQVGSGLRVFVVKVRGKFMTFINPSFIPFIPHKVSDFEGCLSFPGKHTFKNRYSVIVTSPPRGKQRGLKLDGIAAIAFQHELDHLNGVTI